MKSKRLSAPNSGLNAHRLVASVAVGIAEELFELYAVENTFYRKMRADGAVTEKAARRLFVERVAPRMLEDARKVLAQQLGMESTTEHVKTQIYEALLADSDLRANRFVAEDQARVPTSLH